MVKPSTRVELTVPREEAKRVLTRALELGEAALAKAQGVRDEATFTDWAKETSRWRRFAIASLQSISEGDALEQEFTGIGAGPRFAVVGGPPHTVGDRLGRRSGGRRLGLKDSFVLQGILRLCGTTTSILSTRVVVTRSLR